MMKELSVRWPPRLASAEDGATLLEYSVIAAFVSIAAVVILGLIGADVLALFTQAENVIP